METDLDTAPPPIPENLAEIAHHLKEHRRSAPVVTPSSAVFLWVYYAVFLALPISMMALPTWFLQTAMNKKAVVPAVDAVLAMFLIMAGLMMLVHMLPLVIRIPRWVNDTRAYGNLAILGGLPTLFYLACAYHCLQVAMRAHDGKGVLNRWRRRWVADYLICPTMVTIVGRDPPSTAAHTGAVRPDHPERRAFLVGAACMLDKERSHNHLADAWRCVEAVGRLYLRSPQSYPKVFPILQQWLQVVYAWRRLETVPGQAHLDQVLDRCAFIVLRTKELASEGSPLPDRAVRPTELWVAAGITAVLWSVVLVFTLAFGAEKCVGGYITAMGVTFTAWWALFQAFKARKKEAETRATPSNVDSPALRQAAPQLEASGESGGAEPPRA